MTKLDGPLGRLHVSRRAALRTGVYGSAAVMVSGLGIAAAQAGTRATGSQAAEQATRTYDFNQGWLFGGEYTAGAELPGHNDGRFAHVTVPHTVVPLSWADWDYGDWEKRWIYRKHFTGTSITGDGDGDGASERVLLTFDGVMTDATVVLNGATVATHQGGYLQQRFLDDVTNMVIRDRNRPSVIVWGARLDETKNYPDLYAEARRLVYAHDGSRQTAGAVTFHSTSGWAEDVFSYDDYHIVDGAPELYPPVAGVPYLVSEAVGAAIDPQYRWSDPPATLASQANAHALVHDQAQANPLYAGLLAWAGIDYYSPQNDSDPAAAAKNWRTMRTPGVADVFRVPKPGASIYQSQVNPAVRPVIIPVFCWDDTAPPGADAMIATNCDRLELSVDGTTWLSVTPDGVTFAALRYPPAFADLTGANAAAGTAPGAGRPDLQIDGYVAAKLVATVRMTADTSRDRLSLTAADTEITADGSDATAITARATDAYGNRRPGIAGDVTLTLTGPGTLIAANPLPLATLGGVAGGFVRSRPGQAGTVTVTAAHPTLGRSSVRVTVSGT